MTTVLLGCALFVQADDWPMAGHDPMRTGCSKEYLGGPFEYLWVKCYDEKVTSAQLCVVGGKGYFGTLHGNVFCIDAETGEPVWKTPVDGPVMGSVAADGETVYAATAFGQLSALDAQTGEMRWSFTGQGTSVSHVLLVKGRVIYADMAGFCYALDAATGELVWQFKADAMIMNSPASDGDRVFFATEAMTAYAVDIETGAETWRTTLSGATCKEFWPVVSMPAEIVQFTAAPWMTANLGYANINKLRFPKTAEEHALIQQKVIDALSVPPSGQVTFFLDTTTGDERYKAPIIFNRGRWATMAPACVDPNGDFVSGFFYTPAAPQDNPQYGCTYVGTFAAKTGALLPPPHLLGVSGWDEFCALTLAGRTVFRNHWSTISVCDMELRLLNKSWDWAKWELDLPGGDYAPTRENNIGYPGRLGGQMQTYGGNTASIAGGRVYCFQSGYLAAARATANTIEVTLEKIKAAEAVAEKAVLLRTLAIHYGPEAIPPLLAALRDADNLVRLAAIESLGIAGGESVLKPLAKAAAAASSSGAREKDTARAALIRARGKDVDPAMLRAAGDANEPPEIRVEMIGALAARRAYDAAQAMPALARDRDGQVRMAALHALSALAGGAEAPELIELITTAANDAERLEAGKALRAACGRANDPETTAGLLLTRFDQSTPELKSALLQALGVIGGAKALDVVKNALADEDALVREAAARGLADWPDPAPIAELLALAADGETEEIRAAALAGHVRMTGMLPDLTPGQACDMYEAALDLAERYQERIVIYEALGRTPDLRALSILETGMEEIKAFDELELLPYAEAAYVRAAAALVKTHNAEATAALRKFCEISKNEKLVETAIQAMQ